MAHSSPKPSVRCFRNGGSKTNEKVLLMQRSDLKLQMTFFVMYGDDARWVRPGRLTFGAPINADSVITATIPHRYLQGPGP